jgi:hypothetical protein
MLGRIMLSPKGRAGRSPKRSRRGPRGFEVVRQDLEVKALRPLLTPGSLVKFTALPSTMPAKEADPSSG